MSTRLDRSPELRNQLQGLRHILAETPNAGGYLKLFDDFLVEGEFELALHSVCDYLTEPGGPTVDEPTVERIRLLHSLMEITDECVNQLHTRIR